MKKASQAFHFKEKKMAKGILKKVTTPRKKTSIKEMAKRATARRQPRKAR
jgi:hypothetical protein